MRAPGEPVRVHVVASDRYPDGTDLELSPSMAEVQIGSAAVGCAVLDDDGRVIGVEIAAGRPDALPLFYVEVRESTGRPPVTGLVAFTGHDQPDGRLLDLADADGLGLDGADQVGAVRWVPSTGQSLELYVQPAWRRRGAATRLLAAAELVSVGRGWPRLWGDGNRTEMGERMRNVSTWGWAHRTQEWSSVAPPMTPPGTDPESAPESAPPLPPAH